MEINKRIENIDGTKFYIINIQVKGYNYEIYKTDRFRNIEVCRTSVKTGEGHALQKTSKSFQTWANVATNYKTLAPYVQLIESEMNQLIESDIEPAQPESKPEIETVTKTIKKDNGFIVTKKEFKTQPNGKNYYIVLGESKGYQYKIHKSDYCKDSINVYRSSSKTGEGHALQFTSKTFWSWEEVKANYKNLAPYIEEIKILIDELIASVNTPEIEPKTITIDEPKQETIETETSENKILYMTEQERAKDRVMIKRRLRVLGVTCFDSNAPIIDLALTLENLDPNFEFPPKVKNILDEYKELMKINRVYTAKRVNVPLPLTLADPELARAINESIQEMANYLAHLLNNGIDKDEAINRVFYGKQDTTPGLRDAVVKAVLG